MEPITREEYYLAKIAGKYEGKTPNPVTNDEYYLATMAGDYSGNTPQPVTRLQYYMAKVAGVWGGSIPAPVTRLEYYWAAIASGEGKVFPPVTREEHFLVLVADAYSVVLTVVTGNPALLENSKGNRGLESLTLYGKSTQGSTTGANLLPCSEKEVVTTLKEYKFKNPLPAGGYRVSIKSANRVPAGTTFQCAMKYVDGNSVYRNMSHETKSVIMIATNAVVSFTIYSDTAYNESNGKTTIFTGLMINVGDATIPYEPYTGGKPSPSPEYPQEIESVGQDGEIGISVDGGNLIKAPFESRENPYKPGYTFTQNGVTFTVQDDMGIKVAGTNTSADKYAQFTAYYLSNDEKPKYPAGTYTFSEAATVQIGFASGGVNKNGTFTANEEFYVNGFYIAIPAGQSVNKTVYPMLNIGSTALPYEPYKPAQTLIIPTPSGLPGIPVSSGGNYTDADGQQWVCDEVDFKKGVYVQRIGKRTITSKDAFHKSGMSTDDVNYFSLGNVSLHIGTIGEKDVLMSNCFVAGINHGFGAWGKIFLSSAFDDKVYFSVEAQKYPDEETFKQWAVENGLMFLYQLVDIIETPLAAEELSAYKTLRTYSPTTTVINDACAGMSVGYAKMK